MASDGQHLLRAAAQGVRHQDRNSTYDVFRSLGIMGKTFSRRFLLLGKFLWTTPHDALMILLPFGNRGQIFANRVAQLVTYCLPVMRMNMADHKAKVLTGEESFTQYKRIDHHLSRWCLDTRMTKIYISCSLHGHQQTQSLCSMFLDYNLILG